MFYEFHEATNEFTIRFYPHGVKMYGGGRGRAKSDLKYLTQFMDVSFYAVIPFICFYCFYEALTATA